MQRKSRGGCRSRFAAFAVTVSLLLTGCGNVLTGTAVNLTDTESTAVHTGMVTWFDGYQIREATINVSDTVSLEEVPVTIENKELLPESDTGQLKCFSITSSDDITGLYEMQAFNIDKGPIIYVKTVYDGAIYPLGSNWYGVLLPNGYAETFYLKIGNTYFEER